MFVAYSPQTNGVPLESKLATYMVIHCFLINADIIGLFRTYIFLRRIAKVLAWD